MKRKAEQYEIKLSDTQMVDVYERFEKLADSEDNRKRAEKRVTVQALKQELQILMLKRTFEEEDFKKQQEWLN
jgi:hypothetical protein